MLMAVSKKTIHRSMSFSAFVKGCLNYSVCMQKECKFDKNLNSRGFYKCEAIATGIANSVIDSTGQAFRRLLLQYCFRILLMFLRVIADFLVKWVRLRSPFIRTTRPAFTKIISPSMRDAKKYLTDNFCS